VSKPFTSNRHLPGHSLAGIGLAGTMLLVVVLVGVAALIVGNSISASPAGSQPASMGSFRSLAAQTASTPAITPATRARINSSYAALPLAFEANQGQVDAQVKYMARGTAYTLFLTANEAVISLYSPARRAEQTMADAGAVNHSHLMRSPRNAKTQPLSTSVVRMHLVKGNSRAKVAASDPLPGRINYYIGNDPSKWQTGVGQYARVSYENVYPGVNMAFHGAQRQMEFDFIVAPGANSAPIELGFSGARRISTDASGNLVLSSAAGDLVLHCPVAYQEQNGGRQLVDARFVLKANNEVAFALGPYDRSRELVIDPTLTFATYLGGNAEDEAFAIAVDSSGNTYVAGQTASTNFPGNPTTVSSAGGFDAFVSKLNASGTALDFTTLIGGSANDSALGIAVNPTGTYVLGNTSSALAFNFTIGPGGGQDVFVAKLDNVAGALQYLTRIGGTGTDSGNAIAIDLAGNAYIGGETDSTDFPTASPIQLNNAGSIDGFVAKLNTTGNAFAYSTYLGGSSDDVVTGIALDGSNNAYVTGITVSTDFPTTKGAFQTTAGGQDDGFVAAVKADGSALIYSTYLGGSGTDDALGIAVDSAGEAYVTGHTNSSNFPTANPQQATLAGASDVFITKLNTSGSALLFSTYFGGSLDESGVGTALDPFNDVYVTGDTASSNFPTGGSAFQTSLQGSSNAFVTELSNTGFLVYSSYLGGNLTGNVLPVSSTPVGAVAVDSSGNAYLAGSTSSTANFPVTAGVLQNAFAGGLADGFVAKVGAAPADFSVSVSPTSISTTSGQTTATITVTVSSVNAAFGKAVTLSCGNKPSKAACNFSTLSVTPGATAATSNLTISTNGSAGNGMLTPPATHSSGVFYALLLPFGGLVLLGMGSGSRKSRVLRFLLPGLVMAALIFLPACGGNSSSSPPPPPPGCTSCTPAGTYAVTVTGTNANVSHSAQVTLTVN
jgi:hypothetical protein